ncbi:hypothetical protein KIW84_041467 [Lathyrus oleraceus]|uniref:Retroviral polymerase SH3-like domain-containing protein n=1 Tax=Pisum sativum TaxID=3888 RepID=A0A9D5ARL2_PEA|nr:hypothetical protein KIW84_041467 [Pisum sativum]
MANDNTSLFSNPYDPSKPFSCITLTSVTKILPTNYLNWKLQVEALVYVYVLLKYPDGSFPAPSKMISTIASPLVMTLNPTYQTWPAPITMENLGDVLSQCNTFKQQHHDFSSPPRNFSAHPGQVQANSAAVGPSQSDFLVDNGVMHHVTNDLDSMAFHNSYIGPDSLFMGKGYSVDQNVYVCLDLKTRRIYTSRHVKFVESEFPFNSLVTHANPSAEQQTGPFQLSILQPINQPTVSTTLNPPGDSFVAPSIPFITHFPSPTQSSNETINPTQSSPEISQSSLQLPAPPS